MIDAVGEIVLHFLNKLKDQIIDDHLFKINLMDMIDQ